MKSDLTLTITIGAILVGCPAPGEQETASGTTEAPQETDSEPTSGGTSGATDEPVTTGTTTDAPTTGATTEAATTGEPPDPAATHVYYVPYVEMDGQERAVAVRMVELGDGEAAAPVTLIGAAAGEWLEYDEMPAPGDAVFPVYAGPGQPVHLWFVELATATAHELALPPDVARVHSAHVSRDGTHLIVRAGPEVSPSSASVYLCPLAGADCSLAEVDFGLSPTHFVSRVIDVSSAEGWILYEERVMGEADVEVRLAELAAPTSSATVQAFAGIPSVVTTFAPDAKTIYLADWVNFQHHAVDIAADPPGPPVAMHPGLPVLGKTQIAWSADMTAVLLWSGAGNRGDLFRISVDGANIGAPESFDVGGPAHVFHEDFAFTADGARVLFRSDHETEFAEQLYLADSAAPDAPPVRVNPPLDPGGEVSNSFLLPDPAHVAYIAGAEQFDLFYASIDPVGDVVKLNAADHQASQHCFMPTPDGQRIVYSGVDAVAKRALHLVEVGGPQPGAPIALTSALPAGVQVDLLCALTPAADRVLFVGRDANGPAGLYGVAIAPQLSPASELSSPGEVVRAFAAL